MEAIRLKCADCVLKNTCARKGRKEKYDESMRAYCKMGVSMMKPKKRRRIN